MSFWSIIFVSLFRIDFIESQEEREKPAELMSLSIFYFLSVTNFSLFDGFWRKRLSSLSYGIQSKYFGRRFGSSIEAHLFLAHEFLILSSGEKRRDFFFDRKKKKSCSLLFARLFLESLVFSKTDSSFAALLYCWREYLINSCVQTFKTFLFSSQSEEIKEWTDFLPSSLKKRRASPSLSSLSVLIHCLLRSQTLVDFIPMIEQTMKPVSAQSEFLSLLPRLLFLWSFSFCCFLFFGSWFLWLRGSLLRRQT